MKKNKETNEIKELRKEIVLISEELDESRYREKLILSALNNILNQNNTNGVNDYLITQIRRKL